MVGERTLYRPVGRCILAPYRWAFARRYGAHCIRRRGRSWRPAKGSRCKRAVRFALGPLAISRYVPCLSASRRHARLDSDLEPATFALCSQRSGHCSECVIHLVVMGNRKNLKVVVPPNAAALGVDPVLLRAQKFGLVSIYEDLGNPASCWIIGVVQLIDALQDALAETYGEQDVFGPMGADGELVGVDRCVYCGAPIAFDVSSDDAEYDGVWIDATGGDACGIETSIGAGDDGQHGHVPEGCHRTADPVGGHE